MLFSIVGTTFILLVAVVATAQPRGDTQSCSSTLSRKRILLLGETGAGKSTFGNELSGTDAFTVGHGVDSCTSEITRSDTVLFGDEDSGINVSIEDTGGLGDTKGRDDEFLDGLANHIRSIDGVHGVVYVHNACQRRISKQTQESLRAMVATLTNGEARKELDGRLVIVLTQCTDAVRRLHWGPSLTSALCRNLKLCDVPLLWYDDFSSVDTGWSNDASVWRGQFKEWVQELPCETMGVPSESERESLKREHEENLKRQKEQQERLEALEEELRQMKESQHSFTTEQRQEYYYRRQEFKEEREKFEKESKQGEGCFSGLSTVRDRELGSIAMKDLIVGNQVATADGWATVTTFLHWHPEEEVQGIKLVFNKGNLTLTPEHMVFIVGEDGKEHAIVAKEVKQHAILLTVDGERRSTGIVHSVEQATLQGYYAPLTTTGTIVVDNVVASCYAQDDKYGASHWVIHLLLAPLRLATPLWLTYMPSAGEIHPYARFLSMF